MPPSIPRPATLIGAAGKGVDAIEQAITLVPRLVGVVTEVETLLTRVQDVVTALELTQQRAQAVVERTEVVVAEAAALTEMASPLVEQLAPVVEQLAPLLQDSLPTLQQLEPMLRRVTETTDPDEVAAMVSMVDLMPELVGKVKDDIFPVLDTLGTVAPDIRDLLDVSRELNEMLAAVPGFGWAKRKLDEQEDQEDSYRADEEPPSAPDRRA